MLILQELELLKVVHTMAYGPKASYCFDGELMEWQHGWCAVEKNFNFKWAEEPKKPAYKMSCWPECTFIHLLGGREKLVIQQCLRMVGDLYCTSADRKICLPHLQIWMDVVIGMHLQSVFSAAVQFTSESRASSETIFSNKVQGLRCH